jgi:putative peptidoglycan lipid II flippase
VAATLVTLASLPVYAALFQRFSTTGLAIASDLGIAANTVVLAVLLHRRSLVPLTGLPWRELWKVAAVAGIAGVLAAQVGSLVALRGSHGDDLKALALASLTWAGAVAAGLWMARSTLMADLRRRPRTATEAGEVAPAQILEPRASMEREP